MIPAPVLTATQNPALHRGELVVLLHLQDLLDTETFQPAKLSLVQHRSGLSKTRTWLAMTRLRELGYVERQFDQSGSRTYRLVAA